MRKHPRDNYYYIIRTATLLPVIIIVLKLEMRSDTNAYTYLLHARYARLTIIIIIVLYTGTIFTTPRRVSRNTASVIANYFVIISCARVARNKLLNVRRVAIIRVSVIGFRFANGVFMIFITNKRCFHSSNLSILLNDNVRYVCMMAFVHAFYAQKIISCAAAAAAAVTLICI